MLLDQASGRAGADDLAFVHDHQPVAELLGLVHVVGGDDQCHPFLLEAIEPIPEKVAGLGIESGGGLVEDQDLRPVDQTAGNRQPTLHAPRERLHLALAPIAELGEGEQFGDAHA